MNKNLLGAFVLAGTLLVGGVANAANWNGLANYPEVPNSANGSETYFFDKASQFSGIDSSRNYVFGINVVNMHNNQYGEATLFKYIVHPSLHTVYRFSQMVKRIKSLLVLMNTICSWLLGKKYTVLTSLSQLYNLMAQAVIIT